MLVFSWDSQFDQTDVHTAIPNESPDCHHISFRHRHIFRQHEHTLVPVRLGQIKEVWMK